MTILYGGSISNKSKKNVSDKINKNLYTRIRGNINIKKKLPFSGKG